jgi:hypothetical protein
MLCSICFTTLESESVRLSKMHPPHYHVIGQYEVEYFDDYYTYNRTYVWDTDERKYVLQFKNLITLTLERIEQLLLLK